MTDQQAKEKSVRLARVRYRTVVSACLTAWLAGSASGRGAPNSIPELSRPPEIDGVIEEEAWRQAARFETFRLYDRDEPAATPTTALMGWTSNALYVAFICEEPETDTLKADVPAHVHDGPVMRDDCVEWFVAPGNGNYYHFIVNPNNARLDQRNTLYPRRSFTGWQGDWESAVRIEPGKRWVVEMAFPWHNFAADLGRGQWAVQFARAKRTPPVEFSSFTTCHGSFHNVQAFSRLDGPRLDLSRYTGLKSGGLQVDGYDVGDRGYAYFVSGGVTANRDATVRLVVTDCPERGETSETAANLTLNPKRDTLFTVRLDIGELGPRRLRLRIEDPADGSPLLVDGLGEEAFPALLSAVLDRNYYTREREARAVFRLKLPRLADALRGKAVVNLPDGARIFEGLIQNPRRSVVAVPLEEIPLGRFPADLVVEDGHGNVVGRVQEWLRREPPAPDGTREVKTDRDRRVVLLDGEPFFPLGIFGVPENQMATLKEAGFNMAGRWAGGNYRAFRDAENDEIRRSLLWPYLDAIHEHGLLALENPMNWGPHLRYVDPDFSPKAIEYAETLLPHVIRIASEHPAVIGFTTMDEPGPAHVAECRAWGDVMRKEAPYHMRFILLCNRIHSDWREFGDVMGVDLYPWNEYGTWARFADRPAAVGRQSEEYGNPFVYVPVLEMWSGRMMGLTGGQQQSLIYLGLIGGVRGIMWWVWPPRYHENWEAVKRVVREINQLTPVLLENPPRHRIEYARQSDRDLMRALVQNHNGKTYIIAASPDSRPQEVRFRLPEGFEGEALVKFEERSVTIRGSVIEDAVDGYGRRVFELDGLWPDNGVLTIETEVAETTDGRPMMETARGDRPDLDEPNLVPNPGFEGEQDGTWVFSSRNVPAGQASVELTTEIVASGRKAARLINSAREGSAMISGWRLELDPNSRYVFGGRIRVPAGQAVLAMQGVDGAELRVRTGGDWWSAYDGAFTTGADPVWVTPVCRLEGHGEAVFDDLYLRRLSGDIRNILKNPGFERDVWFLPGWPEGWNSGYSVKQPGFLGAPDGPWRLDEDEKLEGRRSIRLERTDPEDPKTSADGVAVGQALGSSLPPGSYVMSFFAKADRPDVRLYNYVGWHNFRRHSISEEWERYEYPVTVNEGDQMFVRIGVRSPGVAWIDAVQMEQGERASEYQGD